MTTKETTENLRIWETPYRRDGLKEPAAAFELFTQYLNMGMKRNLLELSKKNGIDYDKARTWSYKYKWENRINKKLENDAQQIKKLNNKIKIMEINRINQSINKKGQLINAIIDVLIENVNNYKGTELTFSEFAKFLSIVSKIENICISDINDLREVEKLITENSSAEAGNINNIVNNFNMLLAENNADKINDYIDKVKKEKY